MTKTSSTEVFSLLNLLSGEKNLSRDSLVDIIESSFGEAMSKYYGDDVDVVAKMHPTSGNVNFFHKKYVKEEPKEKHEISFDEAIKFDPKAELDTVIFIELPPLQMKRAAADNVKDNILDKIKSAECEIEYNEFKEREGEVVTGVVKKVTGMHMIVGIGKGNDAIIFRENLLKTDIYQVGDKIKACIKKVQRSNSDCQIILSRTDNDFLVSLMAYSVVEIQDGIIEVKGIARDAGSKAKVAVYSTDPMLDPVGACIGPKGSRIKPIVDELRGERVDVVYWNNDLVEFAKNAVTPVKPVSGSFDALLNSIEFVVRDDDLKIAIGRGGQNVRLASRLVGCNITIISETEKKSSVLEKFNSAVQLISKALELDEPVAQFLVSSGIKTPIDLITLGFDGILRMGVFNEEVSQELINRASEYEKKLEHEYKVKIKELGISNDVFSIVEITPEIAIKLAVNGEVFNLKDVADLCSDELVEYAELNPKSKSDQDEAARIVMAARKIVYNIGV